MVHSMFCVFMMKSPTNSELEKVAQEIDEILSKYQVHVDPLVKLPGGALENVNIFLPAGCSLVLNLVKDE